MTSITFERAPSLRSCAPRGHRQWAWAMVGGLTILDVAWSLPAGLAVHGIVKACVAFSALVALSVIYSRRSRRISDTAEVAALWVAFTAAGCVMTYLCATAALPLQDPALSGLDHAAGFNWWEWRRVVLDSTVLHWTLSAAYASLGPQIVFSILRLPAIGRSDRLVEFTLLAVGTVIVCSVVSAIWPAIGPSDKFRYVPDLLTLRAPGPWQFDLFDMQGIVSLPSYHTVLAVLLVYAHRHTGPVGWAVAALNIAMLPSIPPFGGHYLVDMIAGAAVAGLAIGIVRNCRSASQQT